MNLDENYRQFIPLWNECRHVGASVAVVQVRGLPVEKHINRLGQDLIPLAERCGRVMREALGALEATRGAPSQVVERSRAARISVMFEPRPSD